jgi:hypothetical protein
MKTKQNNKLVKANKTVVPADGEIGAKAREDRKRKSEVTSVTLAPAPAPNYGDLLGIAPPPPPAPAPAPGISALLDSGNPNLNSRRIRVGTPLVTYRIANNQRKDSWSGGARYYVQGGSEMLDPESGRSRFEVCVEYPFTDLYKAKELKVKLLATLSAPATTEVIKIA